MTYSSRRKEVDMKKVIMIIAVAAILVGCKGKGTRVQISDSVDKFKVEKLFVVDSIFVLGAKIASRLALSGLSMS